jgi:phospholipase C
MVNDPLGTFCFQHDSMATLLDAAQLSWKYYAVLIPSNPYPNNPTQKGYNPQGYMFTAPNSIYDICLPDYTQNPPVCTSPEFTNNIDLKPSDVLTDIAACNLASVAWVTPTGPDSDHPGNPTGNGGPSWVASIVNAIGNDKTCEQGAGYWSDTAVVVVWDDWGGWYDHVPPIILPGPQGDYELGFRVPFVVVSAYTPQAYVSNYRHEFGSILRFMEGVFDFPEGALGFSDARVENDLSSFFNFNMPPRQFQTIPAKFDRKHFLNEPLQAEPPDDY